MSLHYVKGPKRTQAAVGREGRMSRIKTFLIPRESTEVAHGVSLESKEAVL